MLSTGLGVFALVVALKAKTYLGALVAVVMGAVSLIIPLLFWRALDFAPADPLRSYFWFPFFSAGAGCLGSLARLSIVLINANRVPPPPAE